MDRLGIGRGKIFYGRGRGGKQGEVIGGEKLGWKKILRATGTRGGSWVEIGRG